ncbi:MAG: alginate export family protein [Allosphingosinicella sp.]
MIRIVIAVAAALAIAAPAAAQTPQVPASPDRVQIKPILEARARHEIVDQGGLEADALTVRARAGAEAKLGRLSFLAEIEGTAALVNDYNAFAFPLANESQRRPQFAVVADPENAELNRLQLQYKLPQGTVTLGRQRINLDDQRWVGSVGWRQNEQTFDALRGEARAGPVALDLTYAISQRTIFGGDAGPRTALDGDFVFAGLSSKLGPIQAKLFAYLLDYDEDFFLASSSQSYGGILSGSVPVATKTRVSLRASYARQSDYGRNPFDYAADYWALEGGTTLAGFTIAAGWERLGSDSGRAVQTPMATLHKFNGWADLFLTTPAAGLGDAYVSIGRTFGTAGPLEKINAQLAFHQFDSAAGNLEYGTEWDASVGFALGPIRLLLKYADYDSSGFGSDTRKLWLQAEWAL